MTLGHLGEGELRYDQIRIFRKPAGGRRGGRRVGETREEGNQGFDKSTNFIVIIIIILMMLIILLMVMMKKKIRVEPAEVLPCCRPLQAARFLLLSAFSISSWWLVGWLVGW